MGEIGKLGKKIIFMTSDVKVFAFTDFTQNVSAKWNAHELIGRKPRSEFGGASLRTIDFTIVLDAALGIRPRKMLSTLEAMVGNGTVETLIIGSKKVGLYKWKITSISESWETIYSQGEVAKITVNVSLEEYV